MPHLQTFLRCGLTVVSGAMLGLCCPHSRASSGVWVLVLPFLIVLWDVRHTTPGRYGLLFGAVWSGSLTWWLVPVTVTGYLALTMASAAINALFATVAAAVLKRSVHPAPLFLAALWTGFEYLRCSCLGFDWPTLGYALWDIQQLIQIADLFGVYGVSFLAIYANGVLWLAWCTLRDRHALSWLACHVLTWCLLFVAVMLYGTHALARAENSTGSITVAAIQANVSATDESRASHSPRRRGALLERYVELTRRAASASPDLIIWPEGAVAGFPEHHSDVQAALWKAVLAAGTHLCVGGLGGGWTAGVHQFNSGFVISEQGDIVARYDKQYPVPYWESLPYLHTWLPRLNRQFGGLTAGTVPGNFLIGSVHGGLSICYEDTFSQPLRSCTQRGAQFLINIGDDSLFAGGPEPDQRISFAVFRAIENRRFFVRCANHGCTCLIDVHGVVSRPIIRQDDVAPGAALLTVAVPLYDRDTPYTVWGNMFAIISLLISFAYVATIRVFARGRSGHSLST